MGVFVEGGGGGAELKITAGPRPFSIQFATLATQNLIMIVYRWPIKISVWPAKPEVSSGEGGGYSNTGIDYISMYPWDSLVPRPSHTAFFAAVEKKECFFSTAVKKTVWEGLGTRLSLGQISFSTLVERIEESTLLSGRARARLDCFPMHRSPIRYRREKGEGFTWQLFGVIAREPPHPAIADPLPPASVNHLGHRNEVTFFELQL